jgi:hypothetical protein
MVMKIRFDNTADLLQKVKVYADARSVFHEQAKAKLMEAGVEFSIIGEGEIILINASKYKNDVLSEINAAQNLFWESLEWLEL